MERIFVPIHGRWTPDLPDPRDHRFTDEETLRLLEHLKIALPPLDHLPSKKSIKSRFRQSDIPSVSLYTPTSAILSLLYFHELNRDGWTTQRSANFLSQQACRQAQSVPPAPVGLRDTFKALKRFGTPPYAMLLDQEVSVENEMPAFAFCFQKEFQTMYYMRLDCDDAASTIYRIKAMLTAQLPTVIGLAVPTSLSNHPDIPYRPHFDGTRGGTVLTIVGYNDSHLSSTRGAFLVHTPWGKKWGNRAYGWLPYHSIGKIAVDAWTMLLT